MIKGLDVNYRHEVTLDNDTEPKSVFIIRNLNYSQRSHLVNKYDELLENFNANKMAQEGIKQLEGENTKDIETIRKISALKEEARNTNDKSYDVAIDLLDKVLIDVRNVEKSVEYVDGEYGKSVKRSWIESNLQHSQIVELVIKAVNCSFLPESEKKT